MASCSDSPRPGASRHGLGLNSTRAAYDLGTRNSRRHYRQPGIYSILMLGMAKRKRAVFRADKAVKANARERVGQPKPSRPIDLPPRTGRDVKHKPKLEELIKEE
jgi:hypothetical protein